MVHLYKEEIDNIKKVAFEQLGANASVRLFGARLGDSKIGSRIDLLFETPALLPNRLKTLHKIYAELIYELEGADLEVQLKDAETPPQEYDPNAFKNGVML
jgi:predicted nucleotidyltransferase